MRTKSCRARAARRRRVGREDVAGAQVQRLDPRGRGARIASSSIITSICCSRPAAESTAPSAVRRPRACRAAGGPAARPPRRSPPPWCDGRVGVGGVDARGGAGREQLLRSLRVLAGLLLRCLRRLQARLGLGDLARRWVGRLARRPCPAARAPASARPAPAAAAPADHRLQRDRVCPASTTSPSRARPPGSARRRASRPRSCALRRCRSTPAAPASDGPGRRRRTRCRR